MRGAGHRVAAPGAATAHAPATAPCCLQCGGSDVEPVPDIVARGSKFRLLNANMTRLGFYLTQGMPGGPGRANALCEADALIVDRLYLPVALMPPAKPAFLAWRRLFLASAAVCGALWLLELVTLDQLAFAYADPWLLGVVVSLFAAPLMSRAQWLSVAAIWRLPNEFGVTDPLVRWQIAMGRWGVLRYCPKCYWVTDIRRGASAGVEDIATLL